MLKVKRRMKIGKLTIIRRTNRKQNGYFVWKAICACGNIIDVHRLSAKIETSSCGCTRIGKHHMSKSPLYRLWGVMKHRCSDMNNENYGKRGIIVCKRWRDSFENFLMDMGPRPSSNHSIERIDNDKGYSPSNCKWGTRKEQGRNRRTSRVTIYEGIKYATIQDLADKLKLPHNVLKYRIDKCWKSEDWSLPIRSRTR